ncbi:TPA: type I glyceraldehyde-3-phosphate dehydrogenase, partial [Thermoplasmata archaeon]|nr:type I glyceraldehyde-3-phosphate dehydrogenase [Thermoplasmata archaeon]
LKWDSIYGRLEQDVRVDGATLHVGDRSIEVIQSKDPAEIPWGKLDVDVVIESTGLFTAREKAAKHLVAGAKKVIIS